MDAVQKLKRHVEMLFLILLTRIQTASTTVTTLQPAAPAPQQLPVVQPAHTFWVSPSAGDDTNPGSITRPFKTLAAAVKALGTPLNKAEYEQHKRIIYLDGVDDKCGGLSDVILPTFRSITIERGAGVITARLRYAPVDAKRFGSTSVPCLVIRGDAILPAGGIVDTSASLGGVDLRGDCLALAKLVGVNFAGTVRETWTGGGGSFCVLELDHCGSNDATLTQLMQPDSGLVADCKVPVLMRNCQFAGTRLIVDSIAGDGNNLDTVTAQLRAAPSAQGKTALNTTRWTGPAGGITGAGGALRVDGQTNFHVGQGLAAAGVVVTVVEDDTP